MSYSTYRLFMPVGIWYTRRSDIELQRELWLSGNSPPPATLAELAAMIDTGQIIPAPRFGYCVQYGGSGKYFERREDALEYMCKRWKKDFILRHLDEAVAYADTQRALPDCWKPGGWLCCGKMKKILEVESMLTANQRKALAALLASKSRVDAARVCGLSTKTLQGYEKLPEFAEALEKRPPGGAGRCRPPHCCRVF